MATFESKLFADPLLFQEIALDAWSELLLDVAGVPLLDGEDPETAIRRVLASIRAKAMLAALQALNDLGNDPGREALHAAAADMNVPLDRFDLGGPAELVARLWAAQASDDRLSYILDRARASMDSQSQDRKYRRFFGKAVLPLNKPRNGIAALQEVVADWCRASNRGEYAEVRVYVDGPVTCFAVVRGNRVQTPVVVTEKGRERLHFRPAQVDLAEYDARNGMLALASRAPTMVDRLRSEIGWLYFGDRAFFGHGNVCSLRPLQVHGREALTRHRVTQVVAVNLRELTWEHGHAVHRIKAPDCFTEAEDLNIGFTEGTLREAALDVVLEMPGGRSERRRVRLVAPNLIEYQQDRHGPAIEQLLKATGLMNKGLAAETFDLWSLYPWLHSESKWRSVYGEAVDTMVAGGLLRPRRMDKVEVVDAAGQKGWLDVKEMEDGEWYGVDPSGLTPPRTLSASQVGGLELSSELLASKVATSLGCTAAPQVLANGALWDLGAVSVADNVSIRPYLLMRARQVDALVVRSSLVARSGAAIPLCIVPTRCTSGLGLAEVEWSVPESPLDGLLTAMIHKAGIADSVDARILAPASARVIVDTARGAVWVDGIALERKDRQTQAFRFLEVLAKRRSIPVSGKDLETAIEALPGAAKTARLNVVKWINGALVAAGKAPEARQLVRNDNHAGYYLDWPAFAR